MELFQHPRYSQQEGSLLLALFAAMVIGALVVVLMASAVTGQKQVREDRDFARALTGADAGIEAALTRINLLELANDDTVTSFTSDPDTDIGQVEFDYDATKIDENTWQVTSTGTAPDGTLRTVEATLEKAKVFEFAAFARNSIELSGNNASDSYGTEEDLGIIATNGTITAGQSSSAEKVEAVQLFDFLDDPEDLTDDDQDDLYSGDDPDNDGVHRLYLCSNAACQDLRIPESDGGKLKSPAPDKKTLPTAFIHDVFSGRDDGKHYDENNSSQYFGNECNTTSDPTANDTSDDGTIHETLGFDYNQKIQPGVYCAEDLTFTVGSAGNRTIDLEHYDGDSDGESDPIVIYVSGEVNTVGPNGNIVCREGDNAGVGTQCVNITPQGSAEPESRLMQIYSVGPLVSIQQQTHIGAALYAPNAVCSGGADVQVYGSLVCGEIDNIGGWHFHYDESTRQITVREFRVTQWREEVGGTSSF